MNFLSMILVVAIMSVSGVAAICGTFIMHVAAVEMHIKALDRVGLKPTGYYQFIHHRFGRLVHLNGPEQ
jgi:hypothetical protein